MKSSHKITKDISLEIMRIIAIFFVIFNHTGTLGFYLFSTYPVGSFFYWFYMPISVFCKFSVPLFFMISGALLLRKDESIKTVLKKRVLKTCIIILVINLIYYIFDIIQGNQVLYGLGNLIDFGSFLFSGKISPFIWFLYSYLVFLMILPIIRKLTKQLCKNEYRYIFSIAVIISVFKPIFELFSNYDLNSAFNYLNINIIVYPLLGYYLFNCFNYNSLTGRKLSIAWGQNILLIGFSCFMTFYRMKKTGETTELQSQQFQNMFAIINASLIFATIKKFTMHFTNKCVNVAIMQVSECVFGIYLFHVLIMRLKPMIIFRDYLSTIPFAPLCMGLIYCIVIFSISLFLSFVLKKTPIIKKFI